MFRFEHPAFLWLSILAGLLLVFFYVRRFLLHNDWKRWGSVASNAKVADQQRLKPRWIGISFLSVVFLIIAAANPQWGYRSVAVESKSADVYLALDISNSMLAEDIPPSRLEKAKRIALDISTRFQSDRVGLILFAGNAYMQSPLTTDWHAIQLFLHAAHPDQAGTQGTAIGEAIRLVLNTKGKEETSQGAIIILTDGEDHDSDAPGAIADAAEAGWMTCIIGVGTEAGSTIPTSLEGQKYTKRDQNGQPVLTKLNRPLMMELAEKGNGRYIDATEGVALMTQVEDAVAGLERTQLEKRSFTEHRSYFQWFLLPGLLLIMLLAGMNYKFDVV
jgi:Ca-activated chloride channel family protein